MIVVSERAPTTLLIGRKLIASLPIQLTQTTGL
jgi:hypothetical protein